jgi:hypothetical protein
MARFTKKGPRMVPPEPVTAESQPKPAEPAPPPPPNVRNKGKESFWHKVRDIPKEEWGKRAWIYVYCLEPVCNLKTAGENKYLVKSAEPITDEDSIMHDYGSGRYRLNLVYRKPAADRGDEVDATEIEIYNPKYPPKIPRTAWMNDPRNERWAALLPKEEPPVVQTGLGAITDAFQTFSAIRKDLREELTPPTAAPAPAPTNTMSDTLQLVNTIMTMKADNPMGDLYRQEMQSIRDEMKAEREENRKLQAELRARSAANGFSLETLLEKSDTLIPKLKGLLNLGGDKLTEVVHGRPRKWWEELALQIAPPLVQSIAPTIPMMISAIAQPRSNGMNGNNGINGIPQQQQQALPAGQPAAAPNPMQQLMTRVGNFLGANIKPLQKHFEDYRSGKLLDPDDPESKTDGGDFAAWVIEYHGADILRDARALGSAQIMQMFRQSMYWPAIQPHEAKLAEFLDQVLSYSPEPEGENEGGTIDLSEGQEA